MKTLILILTIVTMACGNGGNESASSDPDYWKRGCIKVPMDPITSPNPILVIGDSISFGYTGPLKPKMADLGYQVIHNDCNGKDSGNGARRINEWVDHSPRWAVCTINHGIWDMLPDFGITTDSYVKNINYEVDVLLKKCGKVIFMTTTKIPELYNPTKGSNALAQERTNAVVPTLQAKGVQVCDLYSVSVGMDSLRDLNDGDYGLHFLPSGDEVLAEAVKNCIIN